MRISIVDIRDNGLSLDFVEAVESFPVLKELQDRGECRFIAPIQVALRVLPTGGLFEVSGRVATQLEIPCGRCLKPASLAVAGSFELAYVRELPEVEAEAADDEEGREITADEMGLTLLDGDEIDFRDVVQEQVVLAIPLHPLCNDQCRGLCPECGADLNEERCQCAPRNFNLKFAALKDFKIDK